MRQLIKAFAVAILVLASVPCDGGTTSPRIRATRVPNFQKHAHRYLRKLQQVSDNQGSSGENVDAVVPEGWISIAGPVKKKSPSPLPQAPSDSGHDELHLPTLQNPE